MFGGVKMQGQNEISCCIPKKKRGNPRGIGTNHRFEKVEKCSPSIKNMVYLEGEVFLMGTNDSVGFFEDREGPVKNVRVESFYIDQYAVTNAQFSEFIMATDYKTDAEKFGWSFVFYQFLSKENLSNIQQNVDETPWWTVVNGAYWRQPEGPDSSLEGRWDHPVVHVSWNDAMAYCKWSGKRLPNEMEWEFAARGGLVQKKYPWGDELTPDGEHKCNIWQGTFPYENTIEDGYVGTAPVDSFDSNGYGLYNMSGNVWEWCLNDFDKSITKSGNRDVEVNATSFKSMRGGSYLCHDSYCNRYRVAARSSNTPDSSSGNVGFRCILIK